MGSESADLLAALHADCFAGTPDPPWTSSPFRQILATPGVTAAVVVAAEKDRISPPAPLGLVVYRAVLDEAEILIIGTRPDHRRQGVARLLLDHMIAGLARAGGRVLFLEVRDSNTAARDFYDDAGFQERGRRRAYYASDGGPREDAILLSYWLDKPGATAC